MKPLHFVGWWTLGFVALLFVVGSFLADWQAGGFAGLGLCAAYEIPAAILGATITVFLLTIRGTK